MKHLKVIFPSNLIWAYIAYNKDTTIVKRKLVAGIDASLMFSIKIERKQVKW